MTTPALKRRRLARNPYVWVTLAILLVTAMVWGGIKLNDNALDQNRREACARGNLRSGYVIYDARYNARLPLPRYRFAVFMNPLVVCSDSHRRPMTPAERDKFLTTVVAPIARAAGLPPVQLEGSFTR